MNGYKFAYKDFVNFQWESACFEKGHERLVKTLEKEICIFAFRNEKYECLETEDMREEIDRDFFYIINEDIDESEEESESNESKDEIEDEETEEELERR